MVAPVPGMQPCRDLHFRVLGFQGLGLVVAPMPGMHLCQGFTLYCFLGIYTLGWGLFLCQLENRQGNVCRHAYRVPSEPAAGPLCRGFRAAVRKPVPPSAVRPRAGGAPRPCLGLQESVQDFSAWGFGDLHFMVLEF